MEERKLTEKESLELIAGMIAKTKKRLGIGDGNMLLLWGYLCAAVAVATWIAARATGNPACDFIWLSIPVIGLPAARIMQRRSESEAAAVSYVDAISAGIWKIVGYSAVAGIAACAGFMACGFDAWITMFVFGLFAVGFAAAVQGVIIREKSLVCGGAFGMAAGGFVVCCIACGIAIADTWAIPLFILHFILAMIIPGHTINRKARQSCSGN